MRARELQQLLQGLCRDADVAPLGHDDVERRFQSLRNYGRLPQGIENRGRDLTDEQIAYAVLGLSTVAPEWAGHAATVLARRFPVGGQDGSFANAPSLLAAVASILADPDARRTLISLRMSTAEGGVNSSGFATIYFDHGSTRGFTHYVPEEAVSLLQPGAMEGFDPDKPYALAGRSLVLSQRFFDRLAYAVAADRAHPPQLLPEDTSEYDAEEAERARRRRLGATASSRFLNVGVDNQVTWPRTETLVEFGRYRLVLMPKTRMNVQSISVDLHHNKLSVDEGQTVINRFLSILAWHDDQFAIAQGGWSGNPVPVPVAKRDLAFSTAHAWWFGYDIPNDPNVRRALALYREARNAEQNYMVSYAVLNYYKIIEIRHLGVQASSAWVAANLPTILDDKNDQVGVTSFLAACGSETPEMYIYAACRVAVAHSSNNRVSDPDEATELRRLHNAADIMRRLARRFIATELAYPAA